MPGPRPLALVVILAAAGAACSGSDSARAGTTDRQPKQVSVVPVKRDSVRRAVDVVGTLTAVDQVTVSSEADGHGARDSGRPRRSRAGGAGPRPDSTTRRQQYTLPTAAGGAGTHARAVRRARSAASARTSKRHPTCGARAPSWRRRSSAFDRAQTSSSSASSSRSRPSTTPRPSCKPSRRAMKSRCRTPGICAASIQAAEAAMKLSDRQLRDTDIRAPFDGYVERRLVNLGELVKSQMPVMSIVRLDPLEGDRRDSRAHGALDRRRPARRAARRRLSRADLHRQGDAHQPGGEHRHARVPVRGRSCRMRTARSSPARSRASTSRAARWTKCSRCRTPRCSTDTASIASSWSTAIELEMRELQVGERLGDRIEVIERRQSRRAGRRHGCRNVERRRVRRRP